MQDLEDYDKKCKVEPLQRAMKEANTDAWINGRRRDHGAERASLPVWEGNKVNLLAHWSFEECWNYLRKYNVPYHPLHDVGFSSLGDVQVARPPPRPAPPRRAPPPPPPSTPRPSHPLPSPPASRLPQSTKKVPLEKWMTYAGERSGRFEGMKAKDGSSKTECGIHSFDANAK